MRNNKLLTVFAYDNSMWFNGVSAWQWCNGKYLKVPNTTPTQLPPKHLEGSFFRYDQSSNLWEEIPKPTPEECLGVRVDTSEGTLRVQYLTELLREYENHREYYINREGGVWVLEKVPEPSPEDLEASKIEQEMAELEAKVAALSDRMTIAMMQNDTEEIKQIQMEYAKLTEGANHEEVL